MPLGSIRALLARYELELVVEPDGGPITGSFWGDDEAGIVEQRVHARLDTPLHSLLHESCHTICMSAERRAILNRDAGGDDLEESAVCYLQILLADEIEGVGRQRMMQDMDAWGYSFRLGNTARWFAEDAGDALQWLTDQALVTEGKLPSFRLRH